MELINYQKFVGVIVFGYFAIKIYYSLLFGDVYCKVKDGREEMVDLATTTVLATIVYVFTNLDIVVSNSFVFYVGFLVGTHVIFLKQNLFDSDNFKTETQEEAHKLDNYFDYVTMNLKPILGKKEINCLEVRNKESVFLEQF